MMHKQWAVFLVFGLSLIALIAVVGTLSSTPVAALPDAPQAAGDCEVTSTADSGAGSLRACIAQLVAGGTITFNTTTFSITDPATITLFSELPAIITDNVTIDGSAAGVVLDGGSMPANTRGLVIGGASHVTIKGLQVLHFPQTGIEISNGATYVTIGGTNGTPGGACTGDCNLVSGNGDTGIEITGFSTMSNTISGNYIGTNLSGTLAIGNGTATDGWGVIITNGASNNTIGGTAAGEGNLVSGNGYLFCGPPPNNYAGGGGILIRGGGTGNVVQGNTIGTDTTGMVALHNGYAGIEIEGASGNLIGGPSEEARNLISGNTCGGPPPPRAGIRLLGNDNTIQGNWIGPDATGSSTFPNFSNGYAGIWMANGYSGNVIRDNLLSGNDGDGIYMSGVNTTIANNWIGTDASGTAALPNGGGISIWYGASGNLVGGPTVADGNVIAFNKTYGVYIVGAASVNNALSHNSIYSNTGLGIDLAEGSNAGMFPPLFTEVSTTQARGIAVPNALVEIFSDEGEEGRWFQGATLADASGAFTFTTGVPLTGTHVTATATDGDGNTSEFSSPYAPSRDVSVAAIYVPQPRHQVGVAITPTVRVGNGGTAPETFTVTAVITRASDGAQVYSATHAVASLGALNYRTLSLAAWTPSSVGDYTVTVRAELGGPDDDPVNDEMVRAFVVADDRVDLWSRDNPDDDGQEPSLGPVWASADLWVRNAADGIAEPQDPINTVTNTVYFRVRNRGTLTATDATVTVYWHPPSLVIGQSWWQPIGTVTVTEVAPGAVYTASLAWRPQISGVLTEPYHTCLIDVIDSADDPAPDVWDVRGSNNIEQRNVDIVEVGTAATRSAGVSSIFRVGNPYPIEQLVDVVVDASDVPIGSEILLDLGELFARWQQVDQGGLTGATVVAGTTQVTSPGGGQAVIEGLPLMGEELVEVTMMLNNLDGWQGTVRISERIGGDEVGGIDVQVVGDYEIFLPLVLRDA